MDVAMIGTGYVGLVSGACFSEFGHQVVCVDKDESKIAALRDRLRDEEPGLATVLLIGRNENEPLTVLDGNHRLLAAMLGPPGQLEKLRVLCGLSPRMSSCCWYNTNLFTLFRYGTNIVTHVTTDPEAELARLLQGAG